MATVVLEDFRKGLDTRKGPLTGEGGSLYTLQDAVINQGGEIEKRLAFVDCGALPGGTLGLAAGETASPPGLYTFALNAVTNAGSASTGTTDAVWTTAIPYAGFPGLPVLDSAGSRTFQPGALPIATFLDAQLYKGQFWLALRDTAGHLVNFYGTAETDAVAAATAGTVGRMYRSKLYRIDGEYLRFSTVDNPASDANTDTSPGGGFIDTLGNDAQGGVFVGMEVYYSSLALFSRHTVQIWTVDPDPSNNALSQVIRVGALAPKSILQYQTGDVLFLSDSGIRSLHALNYTLAAGVVDLGSPIDALVKAQVALVGPTVAAAAVACVEPITGRYWLAIGNVIFVLSYYPSAKITAWSVFTIPFQVDSFAVLGSRLYLRGTDGHLYLYGGASGAVYDSTPAIVRTPYSSLDKPTLVKKVNAVSAVCYGTWQIGLGMDATNVGNYELVGITTNSTITQHRLPVRGSGTHLSLSFTCSDASRALLCSAGFDHVDTEKE